MSKKELIEYINDIISQRAFTYEDRMKLAILDQSPFTIWASDRNCKIKLWTGRCEELYGYTHETALGRDYVDLFVAPDEQRAARIDCVDIIDNGTIFHNLANDTGRNGKIELLTNCFRVKDVITGEYLQAEMGLIISFLEQERDRLTKIINESKKIELIINALLCDVNKKKELYNSKRKNMYNMFLSAEKKAIREKKRTQFKKKASPLFSQIDHLQSNFSRTILEIQDKIRLCTTSEACESVIEEYDQYCNEIDLRFNEIRLDVDEILLQYVPKTKKTHREMGKIKRFKIALSFPGEYRNGIIDKIADGLANAYSKEKILYDSYHQAEFAMPNLDVYLQKLYHDDSELIVVCLCAHYNEKEWSGLEWRSIRDLMNTKENQKRIMFLRTDAGEVDGVFGTIDGYISLKKDNIDEVISLIIERYRIITI